MSDRFELALALVRRGRLADAEQCLEVLIAAEPGNFDALHLLSVIGAQTGRPERAVEWISAALRCDATKAAAHRHLGCVLVQLRRSREALASFDRAIELGADDAVAHAFRASALIDLKRPDEAVASCDRAILRQANFAPAHANRAAALYLLGRHHEALAALDTAIALQPGYAEAHAHRGAVLYAMRRLDEALVALDAAIALQPRNASAHNVRGLTLLDLQQPQAALASLDTAIALQPDLADAYNNRGLAQGESTLAIADFDAAIRLRPQVSEPYFNKACRYLQAGDFDSGWELYERRPATERIVADSALSGRRWDGEQDLAGKRIFVHAEQGLGDTLQFCRYARVLQARGARVVLAVQDGLKTLLRGLGPAIEVIGAADEPPRVYDFHCPLASLPRVLRTRIDSIPAAIPYLAADPERIVKWRRRLGSHGSLIGIRWQGSTRRVDIGRSFPLCHFAVLARIPGVRLISLQKGPGTEQMLTLPAGMSVEDLGSDFEPHGPDAFLDVAAVMQCLDLVITSDTSIAHLAGALGRPTWVALKHRPDWRWLLDRDDSPWYPTMRLFRQPRAGDWAAVFEHMRDELRRTAPRGKEPNQDAWRER